MTDLLHIVPVSNEMADLEAISGDAPYLLEDDDFEAHILWAQATVPRSLVVIKACPETPEQREVRLASLRSTPRDAWFAPILEMRPDGRLDVIDGMHRLELTPDEPTVTALVKFDTTRLSDDLIPDELQTWSRECCTPM